MLVLHAHWKPPTKPEESGNILFWAETSEGSAPAWKRGRLSRSPRARQHPFCSSTEEIRDLIGSGFQLASAREGQVVLRLPTTRSGPRPSPRLAHNWELDWETPAFLAPWIITGLQVTPGEALPILASLSIFEQGEREDHLQVTLADSARFWHRSASLALETLAAQKFLPVLAPADTLGRIFHARWLPILDGPKDAPRLAQLHAAMPPVCRAEVGQQGLSLSPRDLLNTFLNTTCDALARTWGRLAAPRFPVQENDPASHWIAALFREDPTVDASPAQSEALFSSQQAWMRNLHVAGDATFRIAFRVETPPNQIGTANAGWKLHYLLQARDDPSLMVPAEAVWKSHGSALSKLGRRFEQPQEKLLAGLGYVARLYPGIADSLKSKRPTHLTLDTQEAYLFLREIAPLLEEAGFGVLVPPWWNKPGARLGVRLRLKPANGQNVDSIPKSKLTLENLVNYRWEMSLGETTLTEEEFFALASLKSPLVQIRGQWVQLDPEQIEAAIRFWEKQKLEGEIGLLDALQLGLGIQETQEGLTVDEVIPEGWLSEWMERLRQPEQLAELPQPKGLKGELRPYQRLGYSWLYFLRRWRLGACLADDMGLGKTVQTIAMLLKEKENIGSLPAPSLLVCPTSVVTNWEREIQRFAPTLTTMMHQGANRLRGEEFVEAARSVDLVLTSYALVRQDAEFMQPVSWLGVILDEAQNIKNPSTRQSQAVRRLVSDFRIALTGTPVENRLSELWSIMHFLNPGYLGSRQAFRSQYALPIERYADQEANLHLKKMVSPFILRRVKTDSRVIQDLPEKLETKDYCHLSEEQATLYQAVVKSIMQQIESSEGIERRGLVLSMLMQLKQICNHPDQYLHQVGKEKGIRDVDHSTPLGTDMKRRSGKLERLVELLEEILAGGDRALIFTQFAEMGQLLSSYLPKETGASVQFLHGGVPSRLRDQMIRRFQEDEHGPPIFILSLKAGGTGLNLTRANHVFHFDRWWNPAVEDQATDRAFRIGQKRNVQVHKFVTTGTVEESIDELIESKKGLAQAVIGSGEQWLTELSTHELRELVRLRRD